MSNCCASGRVYFLGELSFVCVWVWVCAHTCPSAPPEGRGDACECVELAWDFRAGKQLQSKAHPGAPVVTGVWATPAMKRGEIHAHCSSERVVGVLYAYIIALLVWHGVWVLFCFVLFFWKVPKGEVPPPNGNMKPLVLLSSPFPVSTFLPFPPSQASFPAAFTHFVCLSSAFRQLQHSSVWTVTDSCTLDKLTRFTVSVPRSAHVPSTAPFLHENLVFGMFSDSWGGVPRLIILSVE